MPLSPPAAAFDFDPLNSGGAVTTQGMRLGAIAVGVDGRRWKYASAGGTDLVAGNLLQSAAPVANHLNRVAGDAAAIGAMAATLDIGATTAAANDYAEGYLVINDAAGEGHTYLIRSHPAFASAEASARVELAEPIKVALTADTSEGSLIWNPCKNLIQMPTTASSNPAGVAPFAVDDADFFWVLVHGVCSVLVDATAPGAGAAISPSNATAGAVEGSVTAQGQIGYMIQAGVSTENNVAYLLLG